MKKIPFILSMTAFLLGGQVFASVDILPGAVKLPHGTGSYAGTYSETGGTLTPVTLTVTEGTGGSCTYDAKIVYGAHADSGPESPVAINASGNRVSVLSGSLTHGVYGAYGLSGDHVVASNNLVYVAGGVLDGLSVNNPICGGYARSHPKLDRFGASEANGNVVIISGLGQGSGLPNVDAGVAVNRGTTFGVAPLPTATASNNELHLVGNGFSGTIHYGDKQSVSGVVGSAFRVGTASAGRTEASTYYKEEVITVAENNSINIYGSGIEATALQGFDHLNFHMVESLVTSADSMIALENGLNLSEVELSFSICEAMSWAEGTTITLVQSKGTITISEEQTSKTWSFYDGDRLAAEGNMTVEGAALKMIISKVYPIPEPATGTLSLLALAGLCARRRRK